MRDLVGDGHRAEGNGGEQPQWHEQPAGAIAQRGDVAVAIERPCEEASGDEEHRGNGRDEVGDRRESEGVPHHDPHHGEGANGIEEAFTRLHGPLLDRGARFLSRFNFT
jgi:hypothetical protein